MLLAIKHTLSHKSTDRRHRHCEIIAPNFRVSTMCRQHTDRLIQLQCSLNRCRVDCHYTLPSTTTATAAFISVYWMLHTYILTLKVKSTILHQYRSMAKEIELEWVSAWRGRKNQTNHNNLEKKRGKKSAARCKNENEKLTAMKWAVWACLSLFVRARVCVCVYLSSGQFNVNNACENNRVGKTLTELTIRVIARSSIHVQRTRAHACASRQTDRQTEKSRES